MLASNWKKTEDHIIDKLLQSTGQTVAELHGAISPKKHVSQQAIYDAVNKLASAGVIIKNKKKYLISNEWKRELVHLLDATTTPLPTDGEELSYKFSNITKAETMWKNFFYQTAQLYPDYPIFIVVPHQIWSFVPNRSESDLAFQKFLTGPKHRVYYSIMGNTPMDTYQAKKMRGGSLKVQLQKLPRLAHQHTTIIGDFIITEKLPIKTERNVDAYYEKKSESFSDNAVLERLLGKVSRCSFIVERNKTKAKSLREYIGKDWAITAKEVKEFGLW